eukprot:g1492.t1
MGGNVSSTEGYISDQNVQEQLLQVRKNQIEIEKAEQDARTIKNYVKGQLKHKEQVGKSIDTIDNVRARRRSLSERKIDLRKKKLLKRVLSSSSSAEILKKEGLFDIAQNEVKQQQENVSGRTLLRPLPPRIVKRTATSITLVCAQHGGDSGKSHTGTKSGRRKKVELQFRRFRSDTQTWEKIPKQQLDTFANTITVKDLPPDSKFLEFRFRLLNGRSPCSLFSDPSEPSKTRPAVSTSSSTHSSSAVGPYPIIAKPTVHARSATTLEIRWQLLQGQKIDTQQFPKVRVMARRGDAGKSSRFAPIFEGKSSKLKLIVGKETPTLLSDTQYDFKVTLINVHHQHGPYSPVLICKTLPSPNLSDKWGGERNKGQKNINKGQKAKEKTTEDKLESQRFQAARENAVNIVRQWRDLATDLADEILQVAAEENSSSTSSTGSSGRLYNNVEQYTSSQPFRVRVLANGWEECWDPQTEQLYYCNVDGRSQWEMPKEFEEKKKLQLPKKSLPFRRKRFKFLWYIRGSPTGKCKIIGLTVRRKEVLFDSYKAFQRMNEQQLRSKLRLQYENEVGIDSGGITKDWFLHLSRAMLSPSLCLLRANSEGRYVIDFRSTIQENYTAYFEFLGTFLAKAIFERQLIDIPFSPVIYDFITGRRRGSLGKNRDEKTKTKTPSFTLDDLGNYDRELAKGLSYILENNPENLCLDFSVVSDQFGVQTVIELKPHGVDIPVTEANKNEYIQLVINYYLDKTIKDQINAMLRGFRKLISEDAIRVFTAKELDLLLNGEPEIDLDHLRSNVRYEGSYTETSPEILRFWNMVNSFTEKQRGELLRFTTGSSKIPLDGLDPPLCICPSEHGADALPSAHTCFNKLVLPTYDTEEKMTERFHFAIKEAQGFHMT